MGLLKIRRRVLVTLLFILFVGACQARSAETREQIRLSGGHIEVRLEAGRYAVTRDEILDWIKEAGEAVEAYYGGLPMDRIIVTVGSGRGDRIGGHAYGWKRTVSLTLGPRVTRADLAKDWVAAHELIHMAFPDVRDRHQWIKEGLSTYVERIARARTGGRDEKGMWADLNRKLPQGLPRAGDRGLDHTQTWGRVYWGGALFCFLADVEIRRRTNNEYGLEDALRAIVAAGGTLNHQWRIEEALAIGNEAVGVPVLSELYDRMKDRPFTPDLDRLWADLGVVRSGSGVRLVEDAPLAEVRRAIVEG